MTRLFSAYILFGAALAGQLHGARAVRDSYKELSDALSADVGGSGVGSGCTMPESTEWFNTLLGGLWPHINATVQSILTDSVVPAIQEAIPDDGFVNIEKLLDFKFVQSSLGSQPPRLSNFVMCKVSDGLKLTAALAFKSDIDFAVSTSLLTFGLHDLSITGNIAIHFGQFINKAPIVGGLTVHFVDPPEIEWDLTGAGDLPLVDGIVRRAVDTAIAGLLVMPNQVVVPLGREDQGVDLSELKRPPPLGFLQVGPGAAENLEMSDRTILNGKAAPDPYVTLKLGDQKWTSSTKEKTVNPTWKQEGTIFTVWDREQSLVADVFDYDMLNGDDELGRSSVAVKKALLDPGAPLPLSTRKGVATGASLNLNYQWLCITEVGLSVLPRVLRVEIHKVVVPGQGKEVQVVMTAEQQKTATTFNSDVLRTHKIDPVSANVIRNLKKMEKISKEDIMQITGLDETVVEETMHAIDVNEGRADQGEIDIHSTLYMVFYPDAIETEAVELEVKTKAASLGSVQVSLQEINKWGGGEYTPHLLKINDETDSEVALHVSMNLLATKSDGCPEL